MSIAIFQKCGACKKRKFFIMNRIYQMQTPKLPVKSEKKLCGRCFSSIKKMLKEGYRKPQ